MIKKIILLRHGLSLANADLQKVIEEGITDSEVPLHPIGQKQARDVAETIQGAFEGKEVRVFHSDLNRTRETFDIVNNYSDLDITEISIDSNLNEQHWGDLVSIEEANREMIGYNNEPYSYKSENNGESGEEVTSRVKNFISSLEEVDEENVFIVGHGANIRFFLVEFFGMERNLLQQMRYPRNCQPVIIEFENGKYNLKTDLFIR